MTPITVPRCYVDAGIETIRCRLYTDDHGSARDWSISARAGVDQYGLDSVPEHARIHLTGKLGGLIRQQLGRGICYASLAVLWQALARRYAGSSAAVLDLSASGYRIVGIDRQGQLQNDLLVTNPRCGSGPGINLDRILRKLDLEREQVDPLLEDLCGPSNSKARLQIPVRADRCGVFASSATISDKNQGIPLAFALATTIKSEVLKACRSIAQPFDYILLCGGVFRWQFARDCAHDYFFERGSDQIIHDRVDDIYLCGLEQFAGRTAPQPSGALPTRPTLDFHYPAFSAVLQWLTKQKRYRRLPSPPVATDLAALKSRPVFLAIDVGSTMAKAVICCARNQNLLYLTACSNAGDTIATVKTLFGELSAQGLDILRVVGIGVTGSARYQLQKTLLAVYPQLADRVTVLVENYAHARGSVPLARDYLSHLAEQGGAQLNQRFCLLVDVGGEDTKVSTIDLEQGDLYDNAMNTKCSAGTGSLLDTLVDLFALKGVAGAAREAFVAPGAHSLNATCAVFLLEHARKLQAAGYRRDEVLASAVWTIVENMARSLWPQIMMPDSPLVLLHGQTMQSDPLPLAIAERLQGYIGQPVYCLVPEHPGHRACFGLVRSMAEKAGADEIALPLGDFIEQPFTRRIVDCRGAACGDKSAHCYRSRLSARDAAGNPFAIHLGGCTAINELGGPSAQRGTTPDSCRDIWNYQTQLLPRSEDPDRLVIPRSFAVSEWARFFAALFEPRGIPVAVDTPTEDDILAGQALFRIDSCAPHIGVVGQFQRLASRPHGLILAPQIEFLPAEGGSLSRTCTINQGGFAGAAGLARQTSPACRLHLFHLSLKIGDLRLLAHKLYDRLLPVYRHYNQNVSFAEFHVLVREAMAEQHRFKRQVADCAAEVARTALQEGRQIALVVGREYILNPGVYDSHVGRLLRDKGLVGIPSYALDMAYDPRYAYLYWRNAHMIASLSAAVSDRSLHKRIRHPELKRVIAAYEKREELLPVVQVSTFLCGPDSVCNPLVNEIMKQRPYLRIQADAAIKELAHLENRMNTYIHQLAAERHQRIDSGGKDGFDVEMLDLLVNRKTLDPQTDVICFPTLADNRPLLAVLRSAGFTCLENYDERYCLEDLIEQGRNVAGDSVCAPLAAVYGDVVNAIQRFHQLRSQNSSSWKQRRLLIFNNKGLGPCRQGQYVETHKLFLQQSGKAASEDKAGEDAETLLQFLVGHENEGFNTGFPGWVFLRGVQATILQGVLHQLLAEGAAGCRDTAEYEVFCSEYKALKKELNELIEQHSAPGRFAANLCQALQRLPGIYHLTAFFAWKLHRNHLKKPLRQFRRRWCRGTKRAAPIRIHIDGEAYMRTAQFEALHEGLLACLGFGRFQLTYTPLWGFLEYKLAGMRMRATEGIKESRVEIRRGGAKDFIRQRKGFLRQKQKRLLAVSLTHLFLRRVLAAPLYRAAGIALPESMHRVLQVAKRVLPTRRPGGELVPYVGEAALKLEQGYDLILNVAPEGCMVSSMGDVMTQAIYQACPAARGKIQPIFSQRGDIDQDRLQQALLQALGPERIYGADGTDSTGQKGV